MVNIKKRIKYTFLFSFLLFAITPSCMGQLDARQILNKTESAFKMSKGLEAKFVLTNYKQGYKQGTSEGLILLKGEKFYMETSEILTWFDGKTQWTYLNANEEVNICNPTEEELQTINPLMFISLYKKDYECSLGKKKEYEGKAIYEIILTDYKGDKLLSNVILYINPDDFIPLYIKVKEKGQSYNTIEINHYNKEIKLNDKVFVFNKKLYPEAEIVDLR